MSLSEKKLRLSVFGASSVATSDALYTDSYDLAKKLGMQGWNGTVGGHEGLMAAFSEGLVAGGGSMRGIMLSCFPTPSENSLSEEVHANDFFDRMRILVEEADAWLVLPGGLGSLAELTMCWDLAAIHVLEPRPLLLYGDMWESFLPFLRDSLLFSMDNPMSAIQLCNNHDDVINALENAKKVRNFD